MHHTLEIWDALAAVVFFGIVCMLPFWAKHRTRRLERQENARRNRVCQEWMDASVERGREARS